MPAIEARNVNIGSDEFTLTGVYCRVLPAGEHTSAAELSQRIGFAECGAVVSFEGIVRHTEAQKSLEAIDYHFHPVMAGLELARICHSALRRFDVVQIACEHCTGRVPVQVASVALAIGSRHRADAFAACQYILDELKRVVPIWKTPIYAVQGDFSDKGLAT
ncbi:MAG: molybdopterin synthase catalytic subunit [Candidatus Sumerlaeaceae bacterium]